MSTCHTSLVLVENKPGVLARVAALFACQAFNIHSPAVGETEGPRISYMTVVMDAAELPIEQVTKQLNKPVNVLKIIEPDPVAAVERQLLLAKVLANDSSQANVLQIVDLFRAHAADVVLDAATAEVTGFDAKVEASLMAFEPHGIQEMVQFGAVAITRGARPLPE